MEIEHSEKIKTFHEDQDVGVVVFAFKSKSAGIGLSYFYPCSRYSSFLLLVSDFNMGNGSKEKVRACFIGLLCFYEVFSIKHDLARSCFQFWLKIGDTGDKIARNKLVRR